MDVELNKEDLFNEVYDQEHVPKLLEVAGVITIFRTVREPLLLSMGGEMKHIETLDEPKYSAFYEIEDPLVLTCKEWAAGIEEGRWPKDVRPHTFNRKHVLRKIM